MRRARLAHGLGTVALLAGLALLGQYDVLLAAAPAALLLLSLASGLYPGESRLLRALASRRPAPRAERSLGRPRPALRSAIAGGRMMAAGWAMRPPPHVATG
jgi:hypothetical protein